MNSWRSQLEFPIIAFSRAGWWRQASTSGDLWDASPLDLLSDWQGLEIYDSTGHRFTAVRAFIEWPRTKAGRWLCKLANNSIAVGFEFAPAEHVSSAELCERVRKVDALREKFDHATHREILEYVCL